VRTEPEVKRDKEWKVTVWSVLAITTVLPILYFLLIGLLWAKGIITLGR
jgi:hypothetical protein